MFVYIVYTVMGGIVVCAVRDNKTPLEPITPITQRVPLCQRTHTRVARSVPMRHDAGFTTNKRLTVKHQTAVGSVYT